MSDAFLNNTFHSFSETGGERYLLNGCRTGSHKELKYPSGNVIQIGIIKKETETL